MADATARFPFLDGLRGWAAFCVLVYHVVIDGLPANAFMADAWFWAHVFVLNGPLMVGVFFVVSGFSLSIRYLETGDARGLARIAAGRYLRLAIPIFGVCAAVYVLMIAGIIPPADARPSPLNEFLRFAPSLSGLLSYSLFDVFFNHTKAATYNPPLWTMAYEFFGSFLVFVVLAIVQSWRRRILALSVLFAALVLFNAYFSLFVGGILLADVYRHARAWRDATRIGAALLAGGVLVSLTLDLWFGPHYVACATLLTAGVAFCAPVRDFFENRLAAFLGWISYPLYLVQAPVIYAFSINALYALDPLGLTMETERWIAGALTIPVGVLCAVAFAPVNDFAVSASRKFGASVAGLFAKRPLVPAE